MESRDAVKVRSKLEQIMPTSGERIEILSPSGDRIHELNCEQVINGGTCKCPGVWAVFDFLDGKTKQDYDRTLEKGVTRGSQKQGGYNKAIVDLFNKKCTAIENMTEDDCEGMSPKQFMAIDSRGRVMLKTVTNEYLNRSLPSADDSKN